MSDWIAVCGVDDVDLEDVAPFEHGGKLYAVYRSGGDEFFATAGYCTHERELLCDGLVMDYIIECPKHNGRFDFRTGEAKGAPVITSLETFPVKVADGVVYLQLG